MNYSAVTIQGGIISSEILAKIQHAEINYQKPHDFGIKDDRLLREEIGLAWASARAHWQGFQQRLDRLSELDTGTSITRRNWVLPLLQELGYEPERREAEMINERSYALSHQTANRDGFPLHIVGYNMSLEKKPAHARLSPHGLVQEFLNYNEHLYALVTNGRSLRLLRDATRLSKLSFLEFDLQKIMEEELYAEFALLYRILHVSRLPERQNAGADSLLEYYHQEAIAQGTRIRERLSASVEHSLKVLANGLIKHPQNEALRQRLSSGEISASTYFQDLLRLVYRLLFLLVVEERHLLYPQQLDAKTRKGRDIYYRFYSLHRLTKLAQSKAYIDPRKGDLWQSLWATFRIFESQDFAEKLALQALGAGLFSPSAMKSLEGYQLNNKELIKVLRSLTTVRNDQNALSVVNYADLDVEEFGSVYEGLLDLNPYVETGVNGSLQFHFRSGTDRKETGSYYTNHALVAQLLKTALDPLLDERLAAHRDAEKLESALLSIKICDPACGSGHFLLAAANRMAMRLAQIRTGEENPAQEATRKAKRDVIQNCIYGVDKNEAAVELCKVALWIEGHSTGVPLSFLDHHIRPGDSLVGVAQLAELEQGIPDNAFKPVTGDEKHWAQRLKKINRGFKKTKQFNLYFEHNSVNRQTKELASGMKAVDEISGEDLRQIEQQKQQYRKLRGSENYHKIYTACNLYTYAFFQALVEGDVAGYVESEFLGKYLQSAGSIDARLEAITNAYAQKNQFFHWPLEFPDVHERGGFDLMLGNPPWEIIELKETEFFSTRNKEIAQANKKSDREKLIKELVENNSKLYEEYQKALHLINCSRKFIRESVRFPLTGRGRTNTYSVFSELFKDQINEKGASGFIVPTGIATDDTNKYFFADVVEKGRLRSLFDFENRKKIFREVDSRTKFSLLTIGEPRQERHTEFGFFLHDVLDIEDQRRVFTLSKQDFLNINPNTKTTPIFRTRQDAELTAKIYSRVPVLINEEKQQNPWGISFRQGLFNMSSDSHLFRTAEELRAQGFELYGNRFKRGGELYLPLYESKMIWHYDHRFGTYEGVENRNSTHMPTPSEAQHQDPHFTVLPWYWVDAKDVVAVIAPAPSEIRNTWRKGEEAKLRAWWQVWWSGYLNAEGRKQEGSKHLDKASHTLKQSAKNLEKRAAQWQKENYPLDGEKSKRLAALLESEELQAESYQLLFDWSPKRFLGFRRIARTTDERTMISDLFDFTSVGDNVFLINSSEILTFDLLLDAMLSSIPFDFVVRQKIAGTNMNFFYIEQLPVLSSCFYEGTVNQISARVLELTYTSWSMKAVADGVWREASKSFRSAIKQLWQENQRATGGHTWDTPDWAEAYPEIEWDRDKGCPLPPFKWDAARRALLKAELDAYFALLYGLERDELRYILDPQDVHGEDFPGETFRVLKNKELKKYGEYRTRRLVLEAYDRLRPEWDMEAHLKKLKTLWEHHQQDLSKQTEMSKTNPQVDNSGEVGYGLFGLND